MSVEKNSYYFFFNLMINEKLRIPAKSANQSKISAERYTVND